MPCSTTAVQEAVNFKVTGSNPVGAVSLSFIMPKKKELTQEELFPYELFKFRLEHPDGKEKKFVGLSVKNIWKNTLLATILKNVASM